MEVYALVGPAGTGKSHHAQLVAYDYDIDLIIDDGLLIQESKILAGQSAKREETKVGAAKRALFIDPDHVIEVRDKIREIDPTSLLILGTSDEMVRRIAQTLSLPEPQKILKIDDIATPGQIRRAKRIRREQGKHVIPVPTLEVKKTFSGYMVDPLKLFARNRAARETPVSFEKSVVRPTFSSLGRFTIEDVVVMTIAAKACKLCPGITRITKCHVESNLDGVVINIDTSVQYGPPIEDVLRHAQRQVKEVVEYMTALNVLEVNVVARHLSVG
ncbi:MAG TPA: Asp23/Gls24 family envelope stress response protein [Bacillota bacterium]